jgi:hypothetical protein
VSSLTEGEGRGKEGRELGRGGGREGKGRGPVCFSSWDPCKNTVTVVVFLVIVSL